jgi:hypothetical protein
MITRRGGSKFVVKELGDDEAVLPCAIGPAWRGDKEEKTKV